MRRRLGNILAAAARPARGYFGNIRMRQELSRRFVEWLRFNRWTLLGSVFFAALIYFMIHDSSQIKNFEIQASVEGRDVPNDMTLGIDPPVVTVTVRGTADDQDALERHPPVLSIPYPKGGIGKNGEAEKTVKLHRGLFRTAGRERPLVRGFEPDAVTLSVDTPSTKTFPIEPPRTTGVPARGRAIVTYEPKSAKVRGGQSRLGGWAKFNRQLRLPPISVEKRGRSFAVEMDVLPPEGEDGQAFASDPARVLVTVDIVQDRGKRELKGVPVRLALPPGVEVPPGTVVDPDHVTVEISGEEDAVNAVSNAVVYAEVEKLPAAFTNDVPLGLTVRIPHLDSAFHLDAATTPGAVALRPPPPKPRPAVETNAPPLVRRLAGAAAHAATNAPPLVRRLAGATAHAATNAPSSARRPPEAAALAAPAAHSATNTVHSNDETLK